MTLRRVLAELGVNADRVRLLKHGGNSHWRVVAGLQRYVLRRYGRGGGFGRTDDAIAWETELLRRLVALGWPAPAPVAGPRAIGGEVYALLPFLAGRAPGPPGEATYRRLGRTLADLHDAVEAIGDLGQRPGWRSYTETALPPGGADQRRSMVARIAALDAGFAKAVEEASEAAEPRLAGLGDLPRRPVHGDFSSWNLRFRGGRLSGIIDFDAGHLDILAADVAFARRGYHDAVVAGYLERRSLSDAELAGLDALWTGAVLDGVWRVMAQPGCDDAARMADLAWNREQLGKLRPYRG